MLIFDAGFALLFLSNAIIEETLYEPVVGKFPIPDKLSVGTLTLLKEPFLSFCFCSLYISLYSECLFPSKPIPSAEKSSTVWAAADLF